MRAGIRRHPDHHGPGQAVARRPLRPLVRARVLPREGRPPRDWRPRCGRSPSSPRSTTCARASPSASGTRSAWPATTWVTSRSRSCSATTSWTRPRTSSKHGRGERAHRRVGHRAEGVSPEEISAYGCVGARPARGRRRARAHHAASSRSRPADEAPSNLAIMGRYVLTPEIFECIERVPARVGAARSSSPTRSSLLLEREPLCGLPFTEGRYDTGNKLDWLRATVELALQREDLGPGLPQVPGRARQARRARVIPAEEARALRARASCARVPSEARCRCTDVLGMRDVGAARRARGRAAVRATRRWTATPCGPPTPSAHRPRRRCASRSPGCSPAGAARPSRSAPGQAVRIMTGAPMPAGADAVVMVEETEADDDGACSSSCRSRPGDAVRRGGRATSPRRPSVRAADGDPARAPRRAAPARLRARAGVPAGPGRRDLDRRRAGRRRRHRSHPGRSASRTGRCCSPWSSRPAASPVDLGLVRDDEDEIAEVCGRGAGGLRRTHLVGRRQHGRLRPREGGARRDRRHALDADRHPAGEAVRLRARRIEAHSRCSACPATRCRRSCRSSCSPARRSVR